MRIGIVGLGYVGLPLAMSFCEAGHDVVGVDADQRKVTALANGESYIEDVSSERLQAGGGRLRGPGRHPPLSRAGAGLIPGAAPPAKKPRPGPGPPHSPAPAPRPA